MKKVLTSFLSLLLLTQSVAVYAYKKPKPEEYTDLSFFSIPRLSEEAVARQCEKSFRKKRLCDKFIEEGGENLAFNPIYNLKAVICAEQYGSTGKSPKNVCLQHKEYGVKRASAWEAYYNAFWNETGEYWEMPPEQIYDKYEAVAKDIDLLWNINPDYQDLLKAEVVEILATAAGITLCAYWLGAVAAPFLEAHGFHIAAQIASLVPFITTGRGIGSLAGKDILSALRLIKQALSSGFFWGDLGISMAYVTLDIALVDAGFYVMKETSESFKLIQQHVNIGYSMQNRNFLVELVDAISGEGKAITKKSEDELKQDKEILEAKQEVKEELEKVLKQQGWGGNTLKHREAVVTLYALEYIRAEMADMSDYHRYREAAMDIAQIYLSEELSNLPDRKELFLMVEAAHNAKLKKREEMLNEAISGGVLYQ